MTVSGSNLCALLSGLLLNERELFIGSCFRASDPLRAYKLLYFTCITFCSHFFKDYTI